MISSTKHQYDKELYKKLKSLRTNNPQAYWSLINVDRNKKSTEGNVTLEEFYSYSRELSSQNMGETEETNDSASGNINMNNYIINQNFTLEEVTAHVKILNNNKSLGVDKFLNEFINNCPTQSLCVIVMFFNVILNCSIIPTDWTIGVIKPLYKNKGDMNNVDNYRGITLPNYLGKLFISLLNSRLYDFLYDAHLLEKKQAGFRKHCSTMDHIFYLYVLTNFYITHRRKLFCTFVDYRKAFHNVDRSHLWMNLLNTNINGKVFNAI